MPSISSQKPHEPFPTIKLGDKCDDQLRTDLDDDEMIMVKIHRALVQGDYDALNGLKAPMVGFNKSAYTWANEMGLELKPKDEGARYMLINEISIKKWKKLCSGPSYFFELTGGRYIQNIIKNIPL